MISWIEYIPLTCVIDWGNAVFNISSETVFSVCNSDKWRTGTVYCLRSGLWFVTGISWTQEQDSLSFLSPISWSCSDPLPGLSRPDDMQLLSGLWTSSQAMGQGEKRNEARTRERGGGNRAYSCTVTSRRIMHQSFPAMPIPPLPGSAVISIGR